MLTSVLLLVVLTCVFAQETCDKRLSTLEDKISVLLDARENDRKEIKELRQKVNDISRHVSMVTENDPKIHKRQAIYAPAFTACISPRDLTNIHQHQTIIFDHVITNYGSAYSTSTGIFTAPTPGIYIFFLEIMVTSHYEMYFEIVQDGTRIDDMYADSSTGDGFNSDSALWVLHLNRGSEVLIRSSTSYIEGHVGQIHGYCHSSLSGFLLNELENSG
ncbi:complement C1q subcomponent subunit A-like isoform X1 [Mya arenaria]|uniref:complement C1q subcomponent subunit A-like isoform X1 n=2 Tax=Mya arenaria TaxID=6604 RepID=UPI0022E2022D|nr:complement C1q subcomponent subunit A-like isoform X1 [Mya arenaria]